MAGSDQQSAHLTDFSQNATAGPTATQDSPFLPCNGVVENGGECRTNSAANDRASRAAILSIADFFGRISLGRIKEAADGMLVARGQ